MNIYAIGDLHLPGGKKPKTMDIFGEVWNNHFEKIKENWFLNVSEKDIVLIPGDISWALRLDDVVDDLKEISQLKGKKLFIKGNHDYWWNSLSKIKSIAADNMHFIQNNVYQNDEYIIGGTRGWVIPNSPQTSGEADKKIFERELQRLKLSLDFMANSKKERIAMMHFPPVLSNGIETEFTKIFEAYNVKKVVYGHLHGEGTQEAFNGVLNGVEYALVSAD
ncbi:MAG: serine/threonine protein phosphatase, partial [Christensenellaceae bacterium]|nr:serine/threonine protein phosphatase [Christensenellaceae bacterium]